MTYAQAHAEHWESEAYATAEFWHTDKDAKALISRCLMLEQMSDELAGHDGLDTITNAISDELAEIENRLDEARQEAIDEAARQWPDEDHPDFDDFAPSVDTALKHARRSEHVGLTVAEGDPLLGRVK